MKNGITININGAAIGSLTNLEIALTRLDPEWLVMMDNDDLAYWLISKEYANKAALRHYSIGGVKDGSLHRTISARNYYDIAVSQHTADERIYIYTTNEPLYPPFDPRWGNDTKKLVDWHVKLMNICINEGGRLVVGNIGVGKVQPAKWDVFRPMLNLCAQYPEKFVFGIHEYFGGVPTSGFIGGAPDGTTADGISIVHEPFVTPDEWPFNPDDLTKWHCGRFNFMLQYLDDVGINYPRILVTEHGADRLDDIAFWLQHSERPRTEGFDSLRGWKSLEALWAKLEPDATLESFYALALHYLDQTVYSEHVWLNGDRIVEGQAVFTLNFGDIQWFQFNVGDRMDLFSQIQFLLDVTAPSLPPVEPPILPSPPVDPPVDAVLLSDVLDELETLEINQRVEFQSIEEGVSTMIAQALTELERVVQRFKDALK